MAGLEIIDGGGRLPAGLGKEVPQRGPGAEPRCLGAKPPAAGDIV